MITAITFSRQYNTKYFAQPTPGVYGMPPISQLVEDLEDAVSNMKLRLKIVQALQAAPEASALETIATVTDIAAYTTAKTKKTFVHHILMLAIHEQV